MVECPNCGERMSHNDETTKLTEYVCPTCHERQVERKPAYRVSPGPAATAGDD